MNAQPFRTAYHEHRAQQRPLIEKLQELTRQAKEARAKGQTAKAESIDREVEKLKRELGVKPKIEMTLEQKKTELKERLKRI